MRGFSILEILVVAAIIAVLSAVIIVGQTTFTRTLILNNTVADVGLSIRNAQIFGIGSRTIGPASNTGYGLDFSIANLGSYVFFGDTDPLASCSFPSCRPGDGVYTEDDSEVQTYTLNNGMTISNFCAFTSGGASYCRNGGTNAVEHMTLVFARPNTYSIIGAGDIGGGDTSGGGAPFISACIEVASPQGTTRSLLITQVGEIVRANSCP
jgi:prepilin-type N-terminal cleavage/methylation domain-containing protein